MVSVAAAALFALAVVVPGPAEKVVFLDVGQGDAILLQTGTTQVLIDGGKGEAVLPRLTEELPWFDRRIEVLVATHPDQDHLEGLVHVLDRYAVGLVLLPQVPHTSQLQEAWLTRLQEAAERRGVAWRFAWAGQQIRAGERLMVQVLGPTAAMAEAAGSGATNNASVITRIDHCGGDSNFSFFRAGAGGRDERRRGFGEGDCLSFLLTGDAEAVVERRLVRGIQAATLDVDILKAGHHGSKTSTSAELIGAASPAAVVVSVGADNRYGHPHPTVLDRLAERHVWRTDSDGSVRFVYTNEAWLAVTAGE